MGASKGKVLVGNNEDFIDPNTYIWFLPAEKNSYARVYVGYNTKIPQGGMNEKGLFFDCASVPARIGKYYNKKEVYKGSLMELAMESCSNIEEVMKLFEKYDRSYMTYQIIFADKQGNSVIIETDTMIMKKKNYQIATNFCQSLNTSNPYSMDRYAIADSMLSKTNTFTVDYFRRILEKTHQEGDSPTQYSNIFDLTTGDIYIYLFHNYKEVCRLNLFKELIQGEHSYRLSSLINESFAYIDFVSKYQVKDYKITQVDTSLFNKYIGDYAVNDFPPLKYFITKQNGKLYVMMSGLNSYPLNPISENEFIMKEFELQIIFCQNEDQLVNNIAISIYGLINFNASRIK